MVGLLERTVESRTVKPASGNGGGSSFPAALILEDALGSSFVVLTSPLSCSESESTSSCSGSCLGSGSAIGGVDGSGTIKALSTEGEARLGREERVCVVASRREVQMQ